MTKSYFTEIDYANRKKKQKLKFFPNSFFSIKLHLPILKDSKHEVLFMIPLLFYFF